MKEQKQSEAIRTHYDERPTVEIVVRGGVAEVSYVPAGVAVTLIDYDNRPRTKHTEAGKTHTSNGFDPLWLDCINAVLKDRDNDNEPIQDVTPEMWDRFIGPLIDAIEDGEV